MLPYTGSWLYSCYCRCILLLHVLMRPKKYAFIIHLLKCWKKLFFLIIFGTLIIFFIYLFVTSNYTKRIHQCSLNLFTNFQLQNNRINDSLHYIIIKNDSLSKYNTLWKDIDVDSLYARWVSVSRHVYIYSAFIDKCPSLTFSYCIKLIGAALASYSKLQCTPIKLKCFVKFGDNSIKETSVLYESIPEDHRKCYTAAFFYCPLHSETQNILPQWVSLQDDPVKELQWIFINHPSQYEHDSNEITMALCVRPLFGPYSSVLDLGEFIAYYSLLGIDHFIFYNVNITPEIALFIKILKKHMNLSISLLQWSIPLDDEVIHESGQLVHVQDCVNRCRQNYSHVIMVDLDEFVVPKKHRNLKEMVLNLDNEYSLAGSYIIPMTLFCTEFEADNISRHFKLPLKMHTYMTRQKSIWRYKIRSKVIVKPELTVIGGIHFVWQHSEGIREIELPNDVAILHHYRSCCGMEQAWFLGVSKVLDDTRIMDQHMLQYKESMERNNIIKLLIYLSNYTNFS